MPKARATRRPQPVARRPGGDLLAAAVEHHRAGRLPEAEQLYREILRRDPRQADALHLLGLLANQNGRGDLACQLIGRAAALAPRQSVFQVSLGNVQAVQGQTAAARASYQRALSLGAPPAEIHFNLGNLDLAAGDLTAAATSYQAALAAQPDHPAAFCNLGNVRRDQHQLEAARRCYQQALALAPDFLIALTNLGNLERDLGRLDQALISYQRALRVAPDDAELLSATGAILMELGRWPAALELLERAVALAPDLAVAQANLGNAYREQGRHEEAAAACRRALALDPRTVEAYTTLSAALLALGQLDPAAAACQQALALAPTHPLALANLGSVEQARGNQPAAIQAYQTALAARPELVEAHFGLATTLLRAGDLAAGWSEYEWRWQRPDFRASWRDPGKPAWTGEPLAGRRLFVFAEQGLGDTLQFVRYLPLAAAQGGPVVLECQPELRRLLTDAGLADRVIARGERWPDFDLYTPLLSLPRLLGSPIPAPTPYLPVPAEAAARWQARLTAPGLKVGLVWAGNPANPTDRQRSLPVAALAPLFSQSGCHFYSLQKGAAAREAAALPLEDLAPDLTDFAETAAAVSALDFVITVDTAVAHLAGALGRPVWLLLARVADWRWLEQTDRSAWYPGVRLFRQEQAGDWRQPVDRVAAELTHLPRQLIPPTAAARP